MEERRRTAGGGSRPSLADVARLAGVAPITASRVANDAESVRPGTRRRVLDAMEELGYRAHPAARALATGRYGTIGLVVSTMESWGNARTIAATVAAAAREGYAVTLLTASSISKDQVQGAFARLRSQAVDGVVVILEEHILEEHRRADEALALLHRHGPVVVVDSGATSPYRVVDSDQEGGAEQATRHLLSLGHRTVRHLAGPTGSYAAEARRRGWETTLRSRGITPPPVLSGDWTDRSGYAAGRELAADPDLTAVFAANDQMALGVLRALHESGRAVPAEVSVVGFDDVEGAGSFWPPLTTIRQDFAEVGRRCVDALLQEIHRTSGTDRTQIVPTKLVVRRSTAAAPASR